ncbi:MAG: methylated-DNA--[protein]-cysteine S-methyltransferase [Gammaproteobacteria bacterium]|nr:methylated-DNA--[protein]-cysteine S-methyltransferase [Gammaproteobacteria bacterium]
MCARFVMDSPVGRLAFQTEAGKLTHADYAVRDKITTQLTDPLHKTIKRQVQDYFRSAATTFDLPLALKGTPFQIKVWRALQAIPVSKTLSYGELAARLHSSARAVGNACRANPVPLIVPCHRVVAKNGIGGFSGKTAGAEIERKRWLLRHEGAL